MAIKLTNKMGHFGLQYEHSHHRQKSDVGEKPKNIWVSSTIKALSIMRGYGRRNAEDIAH